MIQCGGLGKTLVCCACWLSQDHKGNGTQVPTHPRGLCIANTQFAQREASRILQRTALSLSWNRPLCRSFIAFRCPRLSLQDVGETRRDVLLMFSAAILQNGRIMIVYRQLNARCLLSINYPLARHRDETHTPVEYALHPWYIPSDVATHETTQRTDGALGKRMLQRVLRCYGKPWTMRVRRERGHGDAVCPSGDDTFVSAPIPENYGVICISGSFL